MGEVVKFPDRGVVAPTPVHPNDLRDERLLGEWLLSIGFITEWVSEVRPPDFVIEAFMAAWMVREDAPPEVARAYVQMETGWDV